MGVILVDDDFEVEMSSLCQDLESNGQSVQVDIYRGDHGGWILEVVDEFGNSTVWDDEFPSDHAALEQAKTTIDEEGIESLIGMD